MLDTRRLIAWPDPLRRAEKFNVSAGAAQPIWVDLHTPVNTPAGIYRGEIRVAPAGSAPTVVPLVVHVWDFDLPRENHLPNLFYLWERGLSESSGLTQGTAEFDALRKKYVEMYLDHRISPSAPSYYPLSIRQTLRRDGSISTDWSAFDADMRFAVSRGQTAFLWPGTWNIGMEPRIAGYFSTPFVFSEASQAYVWADFMKDWEHRTAQDWRRIASEYSRMADHLKSNGWMDRSIAYMAGEPHKGHQSHVPGIDDFDYTRQATRWAHQVTPPLRTMVTLNADPFSSEIAENVDIWAIDTTVLAGHEQREQAERARGRQIWTYFPGLYRTDAMPAAYRLGMWFCWKYDMDGFGPFTDLTAWFAYEEFPNTCVLYPGKDGPVTSIRFELLRQGMEDYEYLWLLNNLSEQLGQRHPGSSMVKEASRLLSEAGVIRDKDPLKLGNWDYSGKSLIKARHKIGQLCERIQRVCR
jgi:hypothetical protein